MLYKCSMYKLFIFIRGRFEGASMHGYNPICQWHTPAKYWVHATIQSTTHGFINYTYWPFDTFICNDISAMTAVTSFANT